MLHILAVAIGASESGQVTVVASPGSNAEEATLAVVNTSPGIRQETMPDVVETMVRTGASAYQEDGLGVGLAIAKNLLDLLGARIQIGSKDSDFIITLPVRWGTRPKKVVGLSYTEPFTHRE